jgi:type II secretory pathway component GspD/PulD (secretin)
MSVLSVPMLSAEESIQGMEFHNKPIADVLMAIGSVAGYTVLPDDTLTGSVSYRFSETSFEEALESLSLQYGFFYTKLGDTIYSISRIHGSYDADRGLFSIEARDVPVFNILQEASRTIGKTILFDPLPAEKLTLNSHDISPENFLTMIVSRFSDYTLLSDDDYFYLKREVASRNDTGKAASENTITMESVDDYSLSLERGDLLTSLDELFEKAGKEYVLLFKASAALKSLHYTHKSFDELLRLLLVQSGGDYTVSNGIYYIFDINRQDILKQYKMSEYLHLDYISAEDVPSLLPNLLSSSSFYKVDKNQNAIIISGSLEELRPLKEYIKAIDKPQVGKAYYTFNLDYIEASVAIQSLPQRLRAPEPIVLKDSNSFLAFYTPAQKAETGQLLRAIDIPRESHVLTFKYLKAEDFLKNPPPPFSSNDFKDTGNVSSVYFIGSAERLEYLRQLVAEIDVPKPQIRYKMLIIQYQESTGLDFDLSVSNSVSDDDSESAYLGNVGNLLSLDFDVLSTFGYLFAIELNASLSDSTANVLADTTLHGLSGESVQFQNSSTYRYQELEVDDDGEVTRTGVTNEISTGLFMKITGWVSGDNMITMEVESTLSKEGTSSSNSETELPPTSERVINTHIRTPSGTPIVIGGLMQKEVSEKIAKTPILGDIPFIGALFRSISNTEENTEFVVYLVPYLVHDALHSLQPEDEMNRLFDKFFPPQV